MRKRVPHNTIDGIECKYCKSCDSWHNLDQFNKKAASYDGLETKCKKCAQLKSAKFRLDNPAYDKDYQQKNSEILKQYKKDYYIKKKDSQT